MASLTDILTVGKNIVTAINGLAQTYGFVQGNSSSHGITATTVVFSGQGRVVNVSVIVAGSAVGHIYDTSDSSITTAPVYTIPMTVGVFAVDFPMSNGIVVIPGTGQTVSVSYSAIPVRPA
jgi:hypothetical protein